MFAGPNPRENSRRAATDTNLLSLNHFCEVIPRSSAKPKFIQGEDLSARRRARARRGGPERTREEEIEEEGFTRFLWSFDSEVERARNGRGEGGGGVRSHSIQEMSASLKGSPGTQKHREELQTSRPSKRRDVFFFFLTNFVLYRL